jgi:phage shock protein C
MAQKLHRSRSDRMIAGVLGGISDSINVDSSIVRLVFVFFTVITGIFPGVIIYVAAALIVPSGKKPAIQPPPPAEGE